jgi:hypothetical protein
METYSIKITKRTEYPEKEHVYEGTDGKRYESTYGVPDGVKYKKVEVETGLILEREDTVYSQQFTAEDLTEIIKAVNNI